MCVFVGREDMEDEGVKPVEVPAAAAAAAGPTPPAPAAGISYAKIARSTDIEEGQVKLIVDEDDLDTAAAAKAKKDNNKTRNNQRKKGGNRRNRGKAPEEEEGAADGGAVASTTPSTASAASAAGPDSKPQEETTEEEVKFVEAPLPKVNPWKKSSTPPAGDATAATSAKDGNKPGESAIPSAPAKEKKPEPVAKVPAQQPPAKVPAPKTETTASAAVESKTVPSTKAKAESSDISSAPTPAEVKDAVVEKKISTATNASGARSGPKKWAEVPPVDTIKTEAPLTEKVSLYFSSACMFLTFPHDCFASKVKTFFPEKIF